jgi:hypothetical protein
MSAAHPLRLSLPRAIASRTPQTLSPRKVQDGLDLLLGSAKARSDQGRFLSGPVENRAGLGEAASALPRWIFFPDSPGFSGKITSC